MPVSIESVRRTAPSPVRAIVYGPAGCGKTTLGATAPNPVFIQTEDGAGALNIATFGLLKSYDPVLECLAALYSAPHDFRTVVLDSLDWLEPHVWAETCRRNKWASIEEPSYGRGYVAADAVWRELLEGFNALRDHRGMTIVLIAHAEIRRFESPTSEPYDRYQPKLHKRASALVQENADCVLFLNFRVSTTRDKLPGKPDGRTRGTGTGSRVLHTQERPGFLAKNRYSLPTTIDIPDDPANAWSALAPFLPVTTQPRTPQQGM